MVSINEQLSFLIVGAQKSGTTSLYEYLSAHPDLYMPGEKEIEFFSDDERFEKGIEWYLDYCFVRSTGEPIKGEASTHYMMFDYVPKRIKLHFPDVKLIMLLRNPVDRAYSHYSMAVRRGVESDSFGQAIAKLIKRGAVAAENIDHNREYVMFGEYGRVLQNYLQYFDRSQIKVVFTEELKSEPGEVMKDLFDFVDASSDFVPSNLGKRYHKGGVQRIPGLNEWLRSRLALLKRRHWFNRYFWRIDFDGFLFHLETELNVKKEKLSCLADEERRALLEHYKADVLVLENAIGRKVPWREFA